MNSLLYIQPDLGRAYCGVEINDLTDLGSPQVFSGLCLVAGLAGRMDTDVRRLEHLRQLCSPLRSICWVLYAPEYKAGIGHVIGPAADPVSLVCQRDSTMLREPAPRIAAIIHAPDEPADDVLSCFVAEVAANGVRVQSLVQKRKSNGPGCSCSIDLVDITTQEIYSISQDLGKGSISCRLDPAGVAASSIVLRRAVDDRTELIVANRFGSLEREGRGLAQEMLAAMVEYIPLLTVVAECYAADWESFTGGLAVRLSSIKQALHAWFDSSTAASPEAQRVVR